MGIFSDSMLCEEEIEDLMNSTIFNQKELELLYERFKMLDRQANGYLTYSDIMLIPEFCANPFNNRIINAMEKVIEYENMTFPFFLEIMSIFSPKSNIHLRMKFVFGVFDLNEDGRLCSAVLSKIYEILHGNDFSREACAREVNELLLFYDRKHKEFLDYNDFVNFYLDSNLDRMFVIDFDKDLIEKKPIFPFFKGK